MSVVVIGGTGLRGVKLIPKTRERGHAALAVSPKSGVTAVICEGVGLKSLQGKRLRSAPKEAIKGKRVNRPHSNP
jgi:hypothetical protein